MPFACSALAVDWAKQNVPAILMAWYPGQRGGTAVADVLLGDANPAGRLPVTFYTADAKMPAFDDYGMDGRTYRYYEGEPLYPFGHGLSYTQFGYSGLKLDRARAAAADPVKVSVKVKNTGARAGEEVVQLYLHPLDAAIFASLPSLLLFPVLGLTPEAGAWAAAFITFCAVFQHAHVRTPRWLGYLIQRPESHAIHHARGVHAHNYADLPLWDIVFGTFRNAPAEAPRPAQGFYDGASARVWEMLTFRDVSNPAR